ncbi:MAG TPA: hypothetical protein VL371_17715 [Gemmataceae bacterium]|nr:hypothetical protein [Gemmataceae bacterium]
MRPDIAVDVEVESPPTAKSIAVDDGRRLFALIGETGHVFTVPSMDALPYGTTHVARAGDKTWTPLPKQPSRNGK